jgi:hypothetical protein
MVFFDALFPLGFFLGGSYLSRYLDLAIIIGRQRREDVLLICNLEK